MTLDTQMTLALLQELLMALRANDTDGLAVGCESVVRLGDTEACLLIAIQHRQEISINSYLYRISIQPKKSI
ncbi:hypothetical protein N9N71_01820 [Synechococcus sp. AH-229-G18]|nr:hypothetical protein [Synechococcus sp. AH-229-G18]